MSRRNPRSVFLVAAMTIAPLAAGELQAGGRPDLAAELTALLADHSRSGHAEAFRLPDSDDLANIPQDPINNPLTPEKVELGRHLFHETAVGTATLADDRRETYSCASCHHAAAGFKAGVPQGIADGGSGFGPDGKGRRLARGIDAAAEDGPTEPDIQPIASPATLNAAYQDVMLWNGALGSRPGGVNDDVDNRPDFGPVGLLVNHFGLSGLETQVLAGTRVHRLRFENSVLQGNERYRDMYEAAFGDGPDESLIPAGSEVTREALGAALAIAAYERTLLANRSPFQRWLRGESEAMSEAELRGGLLFFGAAGCVRCHTGPALSSWRDAPDEELFFAVGFADFDTDDQRIHGTVPDADSRGRGGFTDRPADDYRFKVPQLYNLGDTRVLGHGASFRSVREVIAYKNAGVSESNEAQNGHGRNLSPLTAPLGLSGRDVSDLTRFVESALHDPELDRYVPASLPSGNCFPVADFKAALDLKCF